MCVCLCLSVYICLCVSVSVCGVVWCGVCLYLCMSYMVCNEILPHIHRVFSHLQQDAGIRGPFLIIVPLSTIANWEREFESWSSMNVVIYHGRYSHLSLQQRFDVFQLFYFISILFPHSAYSRKMIHEYELFYRDAKVLIVSYHYESHSLLVFTREGLYLVLTSLMLWSQPTRLYSVSVSQLMVFVIINWILKHVCASAHLIS